MTASRSATRQSARSLALAHDSALAGDSALARVADDCEQQIIDACMAGDGALPAHTLASRSDQLHISAAFIRKCRLSGAHPGMRACLNCDARFLSAGSHNRLCRSCGRG
jgi:hypothetical protein